MALQVPNSGARSVDELLEPMRSDLDVWARLQSGSCIIARDPLAVIELLAESPKGWRLVLSYDGDSPMDGSSISAGGPYVIETTIRAVVTCNPGLRLIRDSQLLKGSQTRGSLLSILTQVRVRMLSYRWDSSLVHRGALTYRGTQPFSIPDFLPLAAYALTFSLVHVIPEPSSPVQLALD